MKKARMTERFQSAICRLATLVALGVTSVSSYANDDVIPVEKFQPAITVQFAPERPNGWELERPMAAYGMTDADFYVLSLLSIQQPQAPAETPARQLLATDAPVRSVVGVGVGRPVYSPETEERIRRNRVCMVSQASWAMLPTSFLSLAFW